MNIELNRDQLRKLLECVHIGSHVLIDNKSARKESVSDEEDLERVIYSQALGHDMDDEIGVDIDAPVLTDAFAKRVHKELDEYQEAIFWNMLAEELGERDMEASYRPDDLEAMSDTDYDEALNTFAGYYDQEFDAHGLDHLAVEHPLTVTEK